MEFPRPITQIHQIEISSLCNLKCVYCPHEHHMKRPKQNMERGIWEASLNLVRHFIDQGTQRELNLAGIGESTLHPDFPNMVLEARKVLGWGPRLILATNAVALKPETIEKIAVAKPVVYVSLHDPARCAHAIQALGEAGILGGFSDDPAVAPNDWAGQIDWIKPSYKLPCKWMSDGWAFIASDGRILSCCLDITGESAVGHVLEGTMAVDGACAGKQKPWRICAGCYQTF